MATDMVNITKLFWKGQKRRNGQSLRMFFLRNTPTFFCFHFL